MQRRNSLRTILLLDNNRLCEIVNSVESALVESARTTFGVYNSSPNKSKTNSRKH